jgi:hypothetical protein
MIKDAGVSFNPRQLRIGDHQKCRVEFANLSRLFGSKGLLSWPMRRKTILTIYTPYSSGAEFALTAININYDLKILTPSAMRITS